MESQKIPIASFQVTQISQTTVPIQGSDAENVLALIQELEDHEDVKAVHSNFDIPKELLLKQGS